ncbi:MAG: hypothetical protein R3355_01190 [Pseudomonas sp.]|uniref:hypothetical protein n=1 Tax=Pseudomonas sp. TaxID=306 RepID=UPI00299D87DF|nr:hypothetical protein [Pseudomonas sp.]MDX1721705.1 hypothetical protein [Pseudomonas sp.]
MLLLRSVYAIELFAGAPRTPGLYPRKSRNLKFLPAPAHPVWTLLTEPAARLAALQPATE